MTKALFLDRDGTLIFDKVYLADPAGVELIPGAADALRHARSLGYKLFLFTNQSGIGRGLHTIEDTHRVNARMEEMLGLPRPTFEGICIAPEHPERSPRLPQAIAALHRGNARHPPPRSGGVLDGGRFGGRCRCGSEGRNQRRSRAHRQGRPPHPAGRCKGACRCSRASPNLP
jgi:HAD superfamily hydrolase (TIGR01662 family)